MLSLRDIVNKQLTKISYVISQYIEDGQTNDPGVLKF